MLMRPLIALFSVLIAKYFYVSVLVTLNNPQTSLGLVVIGANLPSCALYPQQPGEVKQGELA